MNESEWLAERFEAQRSELRAVAYRMLGSVTEAEDAVQEAWLRLQRSDVTTVQNLAGWLTTVVGRVCLDLLRSRTTRREVPLDASGLEPMENAASEPEHEAMLADSVGLALLVVLETLSPDERLALVLHDTFRVPYREIAPILQRTPAATKMLASRARRRVQATDSTPSASPARRHEVISAFLAAAREGQFEELLNLLDPDAVLRSDGSAVRMGAPAEIRGAAHLARQFSGRAQAARPAWINGIAGAAWASGGRLRGVFNVTIIDDKITSIDVIADPERLDTLEVNFIASEARLTRREHQGSSAADAPARISA